MTPEGRQPSRGEELVGRERELEELARTLGGDTDSFITIVGPPGVGKTRLARELLASQPSDTLGVFVSLVDIADDAEVLDHVLAGCGLTPLGRSDLERLELRFQRVDQDIILVLDNAESAPRPVAQIAEALCKIEGVRVLVTSRIAVEGELEAVFHLSPLALFDAALLLQRVASSRGVSIADGEARELANALDRLPLAIELAAERVTILSPSQLQARLRESNRPLSGSRPGPHGSLDVALQHSWAHLSESQRQFCIELALLGHHHDLEVVAEILDERDVLRLGSALVARSWLQQAESEDERSWHLLSVVRTYLLTQAQAIDRAEHEERLVLWTTSNIEQSRAWWRRRVEEGVLSFEVLVGRGDFDLAGKLLHALLLGAGFGRHLRGLLRRAVAFIETSGDKLDSALASTLYLRMSKLTMIYPSVGSAVQWAERALAAAATPAQEIWPLAQLARALFDENRRQEAVAIVARTQAMLRDRLGEPDDNFRWRLDLSMAFASCGDSEAALDMAAEAERFTLSDPMDQASSVIMIASHHYDRGEYAKSAEALARAERLLERQPDSQTKLHMGNLPALLHTQRGEHNEAQRYLDVLLDAAEQSENRGAQYYAYRGRAELALARMRSAREYLEYAYYELAIHDANECAVGELRILLALTLIHERRYDEAIERIDELCHSHVETLHSDSLITVQMLSAARRFCHRMKGATTAAAACNAFDEVVDAAFDALSNGCEDGYQDKLAGLSLAALYVPGFYRFRFDLYVRAWLRTELTRRNKTRLTIERDGHRFELRGKRYDFSQKPVLRKMLLFLAQHAGADGVEAQDVEAVIRSVWPGDDVQCSDILHRAYSTIARLRDTGDMRAYLHKTSQGYSLDPELWVEWVEKLP